eukprot:4177564-Pleurochrysis_carterae.AAC.1
MIVVAIVVLGEDVQGRVEAEDVAVIIGAKHEGLVELLGLELKALQALVLELRLVARRSLVLLTAMSARK